MKKLSLIILALSTMIYFFSCSDKKSEEVYFKLAYEQYNKENYVEALGNFKNILEYYPEGENTAKATFMIGFINANNTQNFEEAKKYYMLFIEKYPDDELADDAQYELDNLGQDINDLPIFKNDDTTTVQKNKE